MSNFNKKLTLDNFEIFTRIKNTNNEGQQCQL